MVIVIKYVHQHIKLALKANITTIFDLFNINPIDYTHLKSTVEN